MVTFATIRRDVSEFSANRR